MPGAFWDKVEKSGHPDECWEWKAGRHGEGYGHFRGAKAHRVAWALTNAQPVPSGMKVLHRCDNPPCVNPKHLFIGTDLDNSNDKITKGRLAKGATMSLAMRTKARPQYAKLTTGKVTAMKRMRSLGVPLALVASTYGVSQSAASQAVNGKTWSDVQ